MVAGECVAYLGHDNRGNYEKGSDELKSGDLSFEDEFVERSRDDRPEGSQYDPNGGRYEHQPVKVDVVVDCKIKVSSARLLDLQPTCIKKGGEKEFEAVSKSDRVKGRSLTAGADYCGCQLDKLDKDDQHGLWQRVVASIELFD